MLTATLEVKFSPKLEKLLDMALGSCGAEQDTPVSLPPEEESQGEDRKSKRGGGSRKSGSSGRRSRRGGGDDKKEETNDETKLEMPQRVTEAGVKGALIKIGERYGDKAVEQMLEDWKVESASELSAEERRSFMEDLVTLDENDGDFSCFD